MVRREDERGLEVGLFLEGSRCVVLGGAASTDVARGFLVERSFDRRVLVVDGIVFEVLLLLVGSLEVRPRCC